MAGKTKEPKRKATSYYCKYCKRRHILTSKVGWHHYWNVPFAKKHPNNCIRWKRYSD